MTISGRCNVGRQVVQTQRLKYAKSADTKTDIIPINTKERRAVPEVVVKQGTSALRMDRETYQASCPKNSHRYLLTFYHLLVMRQCNLHHHYKVVALLKFERLELSGPNRKFCNQSHKWNQSVKEL